VADKSSLAIMIVDDRPENLSSMKQLLAQDGLEILTAQSGNEALAMMLEANLALVLLDVQMPGMDGFEVAELMRRNERTRRIPIIFVTAINKERRHIFSGFEAGAVDYMFKPVDPFIIRSKVQVFLEIKRNEMARENLVQELNEANLRLQEISDRKSDFLSAASHELRTPLTVIKEYCGLVHDGVVGEPNQEQKKCMDAALRNCNRLAALVNDLLDLDSIESGHRCFARSPVDLGEILQEAYDDFHSRCQVVAQAVELEVEGPLPTCLGDRQMITQVLVNLLGNAHKFTPFGGRISIRGKVTDSGLRVEIEDTGPGIEPEDQAKVFGKFTQLNRKDGPGPQGTGLGLAISHKIIELLEGELGLESEPGKGSVFHFSLPVFNTADHMRALVADGAYRGYSPRTEWSLVLLRPGEEGSTRSAWLEETVKQVVRHSGDLVTTTEINGQPAMAILLQAPREGATAFLGRVSQVLKEQGGSDAELQFALRAITRETRGNFVWNPEESDFMDLQSAIDAKGLSYV
jgi:signal transduction histidine kinase